MKTIIITSIAIVAVAAPLKEALGGPLRGPIKGRRVQMRGLIVGKRAQMRGPDVGRRVQMRGPEWQSNVVSRLYNLQSKHAYTRTGVELYRNVHRNFNDYRRYWNENSQWGLNQYDSKVNSNVYRVDR